MAKRVSIKHKRMEAPEWVFPWRQPRRSRFQTGSGLLLVAGVFALFLTSVRIRVVATHAVGHAQGLGDPCHR